MTNTISANSSIDGVLKMKFASPIEIAEIMFSLGRLLQFCAETSSAGVRTFETSKAATETSPRVSDKQFETELDEIWDRFNELQKSASAIRNQLSDFCAKTELSLPLERAQDVLLQPVEDKMNELAWRCSELTSTRSNDIFMKASILKVLGSDEPEELVSRLTRSLCDDIAAIGLKANGRTVDPTGVRPLLDALDHLRAALDVAIEQGNSPAAELLLSAVHDVANAIALIGQTGERETGTLAKAD